MFERFLTDFLDRALGRYIDVQGLDQNTLEVSAWKGTVELENITFKPRGLCRAFGIPFELRGSIGSLHLKVPWKSLGNKPVRAACRDIVLVLTPTTVSAGEYAEREGELKDMALHAVEAQMRDAGEAGAAPEDLEADHGFQERLIARCVDNMEIDVQNIKVRVEWGAPAFWVQLSMAGLTAQTTNDLWQPQFVENPGDRVFKTLTITSLEVQMNPEAQADPDAASTNCEGNAVLEMVPSITARATHNRGSGGVRYSMEVSKVVPGRDSLCICRSSLKVN